jgi:hypothetical protein
MRKLVLIVCFASVAFSAIPTSVGTTWHYLKPEFVDSISGDTVINSNHYLVVHRSGTATGKFYFRNISNRTYVGKKTIGGGFRDFLLMDFNFTASVDTVAKVFPFSMVCADSVDTQSLATNFRVICKQDTLTLYSGGAENVWIKNIGLRHQVFMCLAMPPVCPSYSYQLKSITTDGKKTDFDIVKVAYSYPREGVSHSHLKVIGENTPAERYSIQGKRIPAARTQKGNQIYIMKNTNGLIIRVYDTGRFGKRWEQ